MKRIITMFVVLMLFMGTANAKITETIVDSNKGRISYASFIDTAISPQTIMRTQFTSSNMTDSGSTVPNYSIIFTFKNTKGYYASPEIQYLAKLPIAKVTIPNTITKHDSLFSWFHTSAEKGTTFETDGVIITPNGDGSYTAKKNYDQIEEDTPCVINFYYPSTGSIVSKALKAKSQWAKITPAEPATTGYYLLEAIKSGTHITITIDKFNSNANAATYTNPSDYTFTVPSSVLKEWQEVLARNGF